MPPGGLFHPRQSRRCGDDTGTGFEPCGGLLLEIVARRFASGFGDTDDHVIMDGGVAWLAGVRTQRGQQRGEKSASQPRGVAAAVAP